MRTDAREVIESAKKVFARLGYKKATMVDLAEAAKISRPTLYALFSDKDAVFAACIRSHIEDFRAEFGREAAESKTACARLRILFRIYIQTPFEWYFESEAFDMLINANLYAPKEMATYWKDFEGSIREVLDLQKIKTLPASKDRARVLACFARDSRSSAKTAKELDRLIDAAITLALKK